MRLFVGLRPPDDVIARLSELVCGPSLSRARPTDPAGWHVTLAFIGEIDDYRLADVTGALSEAASGLSRFDLRTAGGGSFGSAVLFAALDGDTAALTAAAGAVRSGLTRFAVPFDDRPFRPHLTLARPKGRLAPDDLRDAMAAIDAHASRGWTVAELLLYRSRLGPPVSYEVVERFGLRAAPDPGAL